jgi:hypothetical protein
MEAFEYSDEQMIQQFLERNGEVGVAELEIKIKEFEQLEQYEKCSYLSNQIELYYKNKN